MHRGCERIVNGILWQTSELNSRTDRHRIFKLYEVVDLVTRHAWSLTKDNRSKVKFVLTVELL